MTHQFFTHLCKTLLIQLYHQPSISYFSVTRIHRTCKKRDCNFLLFFTTLKKAMVCRACKIQTYVTSSQAVTYAVGTLCFAIFVFLGIWLNQFVKKRQKNFLDRTSVDSIWDSSGNKVSPSKSMLGLSRKGRKHDNYFSELPEDEDEIHNITTTPSSSPPSTTVLNMNGAEFLNGVTTFAHHSSGSNTKQQ